MKILAAVVMSRFEVAHRFFANYLLVAQFFGAFPICGITSPHHNKLKFKWRSFRSCYSLLMICFALFNSSLEAYHKIFSASKTNLAGLTPVCYGIICILLNILLFRLAMQWHRIIAKWSKVDALTLSYDVRVNKKVNIIAIGFFICNAISYLVLLLDIFYNPVTKDFKTLNEYFRGGFIHIFTYIKFSSVLAMFLELVYVHYFFLSLLCEIFVIAVSLQLSSRFANVRRKIKRLSVAKIKDENMWRSVREDYGRLSELCRVLNEALGNVISLTLANNTMMFLFFCYLTVTAVQDNSSTYKIINFFFLVSFLLLRIVCVCFCAAGVEIENKKSMHVVFCLPIELYNEEVSRLNSLFSTTTNAIVPNGYFVVNRSLVLKLIGTGLAYELVLLQYR